MSIRPRPLNDNVILKRAAAETKTASGLIIPETAQEKPVEGEVVAVGNGLRDANGKQVPLEVKKGDRVLFNKWAAKDLKINGEDFVVLKETDIVCVLEAA